MNDLETRIKEMNGILKTYEMVGRAGSHNYESAKMLLAQLENERQLYKKKEDDADALQTTERRNNNVGQRASGISDITSKILPTHLS